MNYGMLASWEQWHNDVSLEIMPMPNLSFEQAWNIQQAKIDKLERTVIALQDMLNSKL